MRKFHIAFSLLMICVLLAVSPLAALAAPPVVDSSQYVHDMAGVLGSADRNALEANAAEISDRYGLDVVVIIADDLGDTELRDYPSEFFRINDFGRGTENNGIVLAIDAGARSLNNYRSGTGLEYVNDANALTITTNVHKLVMDDDYAAAVELFLYYVDLRGETVSANPEAADSRDITGIPTADEAASSGQIRTSGSGSGLSFDLGGNRYVTYGIYAIIVAIIVAVVVLVLQRSGATAPESASRSYLDGKVDVSSKQDVFLKTNTSRAPLSKEKATKK